MQEKGLPTEVSKKEGAIVTSQVEFKPLPSNLRYVFLDSNSTYPVIINAELSVEQESKLLDVLRSHKNALGYTLDDLKGINPSICMHRILLEDESKSNIEAQGRLNPKMAEVVKKGGSKVVRCRYHL